MPKFDYFYNNEADQFRFFKVPKLLFTDEKLSQMSTDAKMLYSMMLDRMSLSRENEWLDEKGRVFIYYTLASIQNDLNCGATKSGQILKELDQHMGLIRRKKQGLGRPDRIYVMNFASTDIAREGNM